MSSIKVGRSSSISNDYAELEILAFAKNHPKLFKVVGVDKESGNSKLVACNIVNESLSNKGNGFITYKTGDQGLYIAKDVLESGSRKSEYLIEIDEDKDVLDLDSSEFREAKQKYFPADFEAYIQNKKLNEIIVLEADKLIKEIDEERKAYSIEEKDGISAIPEFRTINKDAIVEAIKEGTNSDDILLCYIAPIQYVTKVPVFATGKTAEQTIEKAKEIIAEREEAQKAAAEQTAHLPVLSGTPKQIAWATTIRAKVAERDPDLPALKKATTAKYWIENYR